MNSIKYIPIMKTRDAELRAMQFIAQDVSERILPLYELTPSRKSKSAPDGNIFKRLEAVKEIQKGRPFILDLCTIDRYKNYQIEGLLDPENGFSEWTAFIELHLDESAIPCIHFYDDEDTGLDDTINFVKQISKHRKFLAAKIPHDLKDDAETFISPVIDVLDSNCKLIIVISCEQINAQNYLAASMDTIETISNIPESTKISIIATAASSFPLSPKDAGKDDACGKFEIFEKKYFDNVQHNSLKKIVYGDYCSVNTEQIDGIRGGTFVPRIDFFGENETFYYCRYRRKDGGYIKCATRLVSESFYISDKTWADNEILHAKNGTPSGISPVFWISVRVNQYIQKRYRQL